MSESQKRVLYCYGDSNTYGYDPANLLKLRYPVESIWTTLVQNALGAEWLVRNEGMNGRPLPLMALEGDQLIREIRTLGQKDVFLMMLGTNDILLAPDPDAARPLKKMEEFLKRIRKEKDDAPGLCRIVIVAPVLIGKALDPEEQYYRESLKMNIGYLVLAKQYGIDIIDTTGWDVPLTFDQVHFSEEGHRVFAGHFTEEFTRLNT